VTVEPFIKAVRMRWELVADRQCYPFDIPAVAGLRELELDPRATFLVGENGSGKSTLLEGIAVAAGLNAEGGSRNFRFQTRPSESELHRHLQLVRGARHPVTDFFLRAETFYNVATQVDEIGVRGYGDVRLHEQSHGESFLSVALNRFHEDGLYLLDEPEAALSAQNQLALLLRIHDLTRSGAQFIAATHSPILLALPGARIYALDGAGHRRTTYDELELVELYRSFVTEPGRYLRHLLAGD
jgi:predicted ATPase